MSIVLRYPLFLLFALAAIQPGCSQPDGFLHNNGQALFPLGFYEHPKDADALKEMADSGVNLVRCRNREDLDRAASAGLMGVVPLPFQVGASVSLKQQVLSMVDHPVLAVWEGPDEIVWNFTAASMLHRKQGVHTIRGEWWKQTDNAIQYSQKQADAIIPKMREAVEMIRRMDDRNRPIWINEALESDLTYVRQYLDFVDITGCDIYPVKLEDRRIHRMGPATDRWVLVGSGKPAWMVLQAFAWSELGDYYGVKETAYPTFHESRFMAYDVVAHGARGIQYWGSAYLKSEPFRQSLYALTSELAALQPFLIAPNKDDVQVNLIEIPDEGEIVRGVRTIVRQYKDEWLIVLINEDNAFHMGVEIAGLNALEGKTLDCLYNDESATIQHGTLLARLRPYEVRAYATSRKWESKNRNGRDFVE